MPLPNGDSLRQSLPLPWPWQVLERKCEQACSRHFTVWIGLNSWVSEVPAWSFQSKGHSEKGLQRGALVKKRDLEQLPAPILGLSLVRRIPGHPGCSPRPLGAARTCPGGEGRLRLPRAGGDSPRSVWSLGPGLFALLLPLSSRQSPIAPAQARSSLPSGVRATAASGSECTDGISSLPG